MIQIDDLNRAWKIRFGEIPNPLGPVPHHDSLFRAAPAALPGFQVDVPRIVLHLIAEKPI